MKQLFTPVPPDRATRPTTSGDDSLGRGMDMALTLAVFVVLGTLVDNWLGLFPVFTISFIVFASVGSFIRMKYAYDAEMERHEAERLARRQSGKENVA